MINRENWLDVKEYLDYLDNVRQADPKTVSRVRTLLRYLLEWAGDKPFPRAAENRQVFPAYLTKTRNDGAAGVLAPATMKKTCEYTRNFFDYIRRAHLRRYRSISPTWIDTIRPPRSMSMQSKLRTHEYYTLDEMVRIAEAPVESLREERDRAAMVFLYLSGMRVGAFVSLPINCVDVHKGKVWQEPERGVRTKNKKAAVTAMLSIGELNPVVMAWDKKVRESLPNDAIWYSTIDQGSDHLVYQNRSAEGRRLLLSDGMKSLCGSAGVEYKSPHKLRHGHVVYALKLVKDMAGLKAVSQNVMHSSVAITDGIYGALLEDDVHDLIHSLGNPNNNNFSLKKENHDEKLTKLKQALEDLGY